MGTTPHTTRHDTTRGRNGFDGDIEAYCCMPSFCQLVKMAELNIIADDYNYALAA